MTRREVSMRAALPSIQALRARIQALYRQAADERQRDTLLSTAFEELATAVDLLDMIRADLQTQEEVLANTRATLEQESQRYHDLFAQAPMAYLVTNLAGTIRQANTQATILLQAPEARLIGRALAMFLVEGQRLAFRDWLSTVVQATTPQVRHLQLRTQLRAVVMAELVGSPLRGPRGTANAIAWLIRERSEPVAAAVDVTASEVR